MENEHFRGGTMKNGTVNNVSGTIYNAYKTMCKLRQLKQCLRNDESYKHFLWTMKHLVSNAYMFTKLWNPKKCIVELQKYHILFIFHIPFVTLFLSYPSIKPLISTIFIINMGYLVIFRLIYFCVF